MLCFSLLEVIIISNSTARPWFKGQPFQPLRPSACFRRQMCAEGGEGRSAEGEVVKLIRLVDPSRSYRVLNGVYIPLDPEQPWKNEGSKPPNNMAY